MYEAANPTSELSFRSGAHRPLWATTDTIIRDIINPSDIPLDEQIELNWIELATALLDAGDWLQYAPCAGVREIGRRIEKAAQSEFESLERKLGIVCHGGPSLKNTLRVKTRNCLLRHLQRTQHPTLSADAASKVIYSGLSRYQRNQWRNDQTSTEPPTSEPKVTYWRILKITDNIPASRTIRSILAI